MKNLVVPSKYNGKKLSKFVLDTFPFLSQNTLFKALRKKDVKINNVRVNKDCNVFENDNIQIYITDNFLFPNIDLNIVFEDDNILIINKCANLEVVGNNSLTSIVHSKYASSSFLPMPCHRLDRNTTGLILFAKNEESLNILLDKFKNHEIKKFYHALVYGTPHPRTAKLEAFLFKDSKHSLVYVFDEFKKGSQKIITSYSILQEFQDGSSLLDVEIETGKTHQIRAHLAHIGYPIIGDRKIW